jgi:hypothetical protein
MQANRGFTAKYRSANQGLGSPSKLKAPYLISLQKLFNRPGPCGRGQGHTAEGKIVACTEEKLEKQTEPRKAVAERKNGRGRLRHNSDTEPWETA